MNAAFGLHWRRAPAHTSIRYILHVLEHQAVDQIYRKHAAGLCSAITDPARRVIAIDGKATLQTKLRQFHRSQGGPGVARLRRRSRSSSWHTSIVEEKSNGNPRRAASCSANSMSRTASLPLMPCIAPKKTFEASCRTGAGSPHRPTEGQSAPRAVAESRKPPALPSAARQQPHLGLHRAQPTRNEVGLRLQRDPLRCRNRVEVSHQIYRPRHPRCPASRCQDRPLEPHRRGRILRGQFLPYRRASPPPQSGTIGTSRTIHCTTLVTSLSRKINPASVVTRVSSSCGCRSFSLYNMLCRNRTSSFSQDRYAAALAGFSALANWCFS